MTRNKDLKRLVRARMKKTGEAYTAARAQIAATPTTNPPTAAPTDAVASANYAKLAGMSDESVKAKTGCPWDRWVRTLDHHGADRMSHGEIAALVNTKYKVDGWWSQAVAVGYERIKGLRARGQGRNGTFEATKSRTFNVPVTSLFDAWAKPATRRRWLDGARVKVRTATAPKSMRLDWSDASIDGLGDIGGIIAVGFIDKGKSKSAVALAHAKLPDRETANRLKQYWSERLDTLHELLAAE